jgi:hypothetical protein
MPHLILLWYILKLLPIMRSCMLYYFWELSIRHFTFCALPMQYIFSASWFKIRTLHILTISLFLLLIHVFFKSTHFSKVSKFTYVALSIPMGKLKIVLHVSCSVRLNRLNLDMYYVSMLSNFFEAYKESVKNFQKQKIRQMIWVL